MAIAELATATQVQRDYYAALCSASNDHDRKLEFMAKVGRSGAGVTVPECNGVIARAAVDVPWRRLARLS